MDELSQFWQTLLDSSTEKRQKLQDAQKREHYVREADEVVAWISDREAVASSEELGKDLEHVEMLQKNFADFMKDLEANEARVAELNKLAKKLLREKHPDSELIESRQEAVKQNWDELTSVAKEREEKLAGAHEIQKFNRLAHEIQTCVQQQSLGGEGGQIIGDLTGLYGKKDTLTTFAPPPCHIPLLLEEEGGSLFALL